MKCRTCGKDMRHKRAISFNGYRISGYACPCGEIFFDPEEAQKILLLNKLKRAIIKAKLGKMRSNLILRLPKDVETALDFHEGEEVTLRVERGGLRIVKT